MGEARGGVESKPRLNPHGDFREERTMEPSKYQKDILDAVKRNENCLIQAVAGSGKSKTLEMICNQIGRSQKIILLAFNKRIAEELKSRGLPAATFNSVGFRALKNFGSSLDFDKTSRHVMAMADNYPTVDAGMVLSLVNKAYVAGITPNVFGVKKVIKEDNIQNWFDLSEEYDLGVEDLMEEDQAKTIECARMAYESCLKEHHVMSFADQILMPVIFQLPMPKYDWVLVDEAQDTNQLQIEFIRLMMKPTSHIVAVGDRNQSLYRFRGADSKAMDCIGRAFRCIEYPLSVSYRCPKTVVREAKSYVSQIEASEWAKDGEVRTMGPWDYSDLKEGDLVVCRNNAPLFKAALHAMSHGMRVMVGGPEFEVKLRKQIIKICGKRVSPSAVSIETFKDRAYVWMERQIDKLKKSRKDYKIESFMDDYDSLMAVVDSFDCENMADVIAKISSLTAECSPNKVISFMSVHRSKGTESERVFWMDSWRTSKSENPEDQFVEQCIKYVAITRAKSSLFYIDSNNLGRPKENAA